VHLLDRGAAPASSGRKATKSGESLRRGFETPPPRTCRLIRSTTAFCRRRLSHLNAHCPPPPSPLIPTAPISTTRDNIITPTRPLQHPGCPRNMPSQGYERVRWPGYPRRFSLDPAHDATAQPWHRSRRTRPTDRTTQVAAQDEDDSQVASLSAQQWPPASPPPSFHSRASSPNGTSRRVLAEDPAPSEEDRTLADTFDSDSDDDDDEHDGRDDRQRLMRGNPQPEDDPPVTPGMPRRLTELPVFNPQAQSNGRVYGGGNGGVWANLSAKPTRGEDAEEKPPVRITPLEHQAMC